MANAIDIKAFIDERRISAFQWFLVAMCFLVVVADGMDVAIMGFLSRRRSCRSGIFQGLPLAS
jgi:MFS transporter, AAHS family, 4-hydroxybenzoate transporter